MEKIEILERIEEYEMNILKSPYFIIKKLQKEILIKNAHFFKGNILDIGCGSKPYKEYIKYNIYVGLDSDPGVGPDIESSVESIPCTDESFEGIICSEVLEHVKDTRQAISEIYRVLKKNGYLYITVPMMWALHYEPEDYFRFTKYGISYLLTEQGFIIKDVERVGGIFSLIGARFADVIFHLITRAFNFMSARNAERIASIMILPVSVVFYCLSKLFDNIDKRDALV